MATRSASEETMEAGAAGDFGLQSENYSGNSTEDREAVAETRIRKSLLTASGQHTLAVGR